MLEERKRRKKDSFFFFFFLSPLGVTHHFTRSVKRQAVTSGRRGERPISFHLTLLKDLIFRGSSFLKEEEATDENVPKSLFTLPPSPPPLPKSLFT